MKGHGISTEAARTELATRLEAAEALNTTLSEALNWALGCGEDFPAREDGQGAYWWRTELAKRSGLSYDKEAGRYVPLAALPDKQGGQS